MIWLSRHSCEENKFGFLHMDDWMRYKEGTMEIQEVSRASDKHKVSSSAHCDIVVRCGREGQ